MPPSAEREGAFEQLRSFCEARGWKAHACWGTWGPCRKVQVTTDDRVELTKDFVKNDDEGAVAILALFEPAPVHGYGRGDEDALRAAAAAVVAAVMGDDPPVPRGYNDGIRATAETALRKHWPAVPVGDGPDFDHEVGFMDPAAVPVGDERSLGRCFDCANGISPCRLGHRPTAAPAVPVGRRADDESLRQARALVEYVSCGGVPWADLSVEQVAQVLDMLSAAGEETAPIGTREALAFVAEKCPDCGGSGRHDDDSHPGAASSDCDTCGSTGYVPRSAAVPVGGDAQGDLDSLIRELAKILGPGKAPRGVGRVEYWIARVGEGLARAEAVGGDGLDVVADPTLAEFIQFCASSDRRGLARDVRRCLGEFTVARLSSTREGTGS